MEGQQLERVVQVLVLLPEVVEQGSVLERGVKDRWARLMGTATRRKGLKIRKNCMRSRQLCRDCMEAPLAEPITTGFISKRTSMPSRHKGAMQTGGEGLSESPHSGRGLTLSTLKRLAALLV